MSEYINLLTYWAKAESYKLQGIYFCNIRLLPCSTQRSKGQLNRYSQIKFTLVRNGPESVHMKFNFLYWNV